MKTLELMFRHNNQQHVFSFDENPLDKDMVIDLARVLKGHIDSGSFTNIHVLRVESEEVDV